MITFGITHFRSRQDGVFARVEEITWDDFVKFILEGHQESAEKETVPLFNATRFKTVEEAAESNRDSVRYDRHTDQTIVRRLKENVVAVDLLILDYDGKMNLEEAKERFKDWEHVGYTSFGHLSEPGQHKFRLILPLTEPIPAYTRRDDRGNVETGEFYELSEAILEGAKDCDPVVLQPNQPYYVPSAPPNRINVAKCWHNPGKITDWTIWRRNQDPELSQKTGNLPTIARGLINRQLDPNQPFSRQRGGVVLAKEATTSRFTDIICPFHADDKGSEFLIKYESGVVCFRCKICGTFTMAPLDDPVIDVPTLGSTVEEFEVKEDGPLVVFDKPSPYADARDRSRVRKVLDKARKSIEDGMSKRFPEPHVIYLPEGAGKSRLALELARYGRSERIIFACKSWKQVFEKFESFKETLASQGKSAVVALSAEGRLLKRFGVKYQRESSAGFRVGKIRVEETIREIQAAHPHLSRKFVRLSFHILGGDAERLLDLVERVENDEADREPEGIADDELKCFDPDVTDASPVIVFTTIARLRLLQSIKEFVPKKWLIWIDDPDIDEFLDIKPVKARSEASKCKPKTRIIDGTRYDLRNTDHRLVEALRWHHCIYTTTEKMTLRLMENAFRWVNIRFHVHGKRELLYNGNITLLGTSAVRKSRDAVVPLIVRRLAKEGFQTTLIAEGIPADFNHSTSKGRNDLDESDIIVEISQPHRDQVKTICDQLSVEFDKDRDIIAKELMLDKLHQAVGRNSGYRHKGFECVVLADAKAHEYLRKNCGYSLDNENSVIIDRTQKMLRSERRTTETASPLVQKIEERINNFPRYVEQSRQIRSDFNDVVKRFEDPGRRDDYIVRLLHALTSYAGTDVLPSSGTVQPNSTTEKFTEFANWVLDQVLPENRERIVSEYRSDREKQKI